MRPSSPHDHHQRPRLGQGSNQQDDIVVSLGFLSLYRHSEFSEKNEVKKLRKKKHNMPLPQVLNRLQLESKNTTQKIEGLKRIFVKIQLKKWDWPKLQP